MKPHVRKIRGEWRVYYWAGCVAIAASLSDLADKWFYVEGLLKTDKRRLKEAIDSDLA